MNRVQEYMVEKYSIPYKCIITGETRPLWHWYVALNHDRFLKVFNSTALVKAVE